MNQGQLINLCTLVIGKKILDELIIDPSIIDMVIDLFSKTKNRKINLTFSHLNVVSFHLYIVH